MSNSNRTAAEARRFVEVLADAADDPHTWAAVVSSLTLNKRPNSDSHIARLAESVAAKHRPADWHTDCDGCKGDGIYYGRGYVENGVFKGTTGTCYRCGGKGYQTKADSKRNRYYDNRVRRVYA